MPLPVAAQTRSRTWCQGSWAGQAIIHPSSRRSYPPSHHNLSTSVKMASGPYGAVQSYDHWLNLGVPLNRQVQCRMRRRPSGYPVSKSINRGHSLGKRARGGHESERPVTCTDEDRESKFGRVYSVSGPVVIAEQMVRGCPTFASRALMLNDCLLLLLSSFRLELRCTSWYDPCIRTFAMTLWTGLTVLAVSSVAEHSRCESDTMN